ncbi:MAG: hypothetical protein KAX25_03090, partial [Dehalococcoidia bacterium]|nr:hypothetical protein [Dehalococcoidia bacterium]
MSPLRRPVILDNDVISRLFAAGALRQILELWPKGTFLVTGRVLDEVRKWRARGQELSGLLEEMESDGILEVVAVDESSEEEAEAYMRLALQNKLGRGETASIAIASNRGFDLATDD